ncbi:MAG TPA: 1-acyl-sn-glycerol-3-phosphate acyltransferase, partial [Gemmatimonadales bacterium]|nr:1-acyl-sn-glycerol-3-phosphate acyltransferase [Gemmatimonadales bacterium]
VGALLRWFGGTPIDRSVNSGTVEQAVARFRSSERYIFGVAPEGTRKAVKEWKRGFWHVARGAGVPIVPIVIDWSRREVAITPEFHATDDPDHDVAVLRSRYAGSMAKQQELYVE